MKLSRFIFIVGLLLLAVACGNGELEPEPEPELEYEAYDKKPELSETDSRYDLMFSGRYRSEYLDDLDFLYNTLIENFPFINVIYRRSGVDLHYHFRILREHIETIENIWDDQHFAGMLDGLFIQHAQSQGHFDMLTDRNFIKDHIEFFSYSVANNNYRFSHFLQEFDNPATRNLHKFTDDDFKPPQTGEQSSIYATSSNNIQTDILEDGRIAYVNILGMRGDTMHLDRETLFDFFHEVADYEHLIIDIRQNGGGHSNFFPNLVMYPNLNETKEFYFYLFMMGGDHNRHMLRPWFGEFGEADGFRPINDAIIERLPYLNADDLVFLDYYSPMHFYFEPVYGNAIFGGKIWLLVSEVNFSASELAADMAKNTGFATLVGETTSGDGIGFQPLILTLPNTGIVIRYSAPYGTDSLGRNNQEFGTDPHIFNMPGKDALMTTLYLIG